MSVTITPSSAPLTWRNASNSTWPSLKIYNWHSVQQFTYALESMFGLALADSKHQDLSIDIARSLSVAETYFDEINFNISMHEAVTLTPVAKRNIETELASSLLIVSALQNSISKALTDEFNIVDDKDLLVDFNRVFEEGLAVTKVESYNLGLVLEDFIDVQDITKFNLRKVLVDSFSVLDSLKKHNATEYAESLNINDEEFNHISVVLEDLLSIIDKFKFSLDISIEDAFLILDEYTDAIHFSREYVESLQVVDDKTNHTSKALEDAVNVSDSIKSLLGKNISEVVNVLDEIGRVAQFWRNYLEPVNIGENLGKSLIHQLEEEAIRVRDDSKYHVNKNLINTLTMEAWFKKASHYKRGETLGLKIRDEVSKNIRTELDELLVIIDDYVRGLHGVLSDIALSRDPIDSLSEFEDLVLNGRPAGYGHFKSFIQGDYTYTKALFKAILSSTQLTGRTSLDNMKIEVDLPDVIERGQTIISDADNGASITYQKFFYINPEITVSFKGGSVIAIPELSNQSDSGFTVKLKDPASGSYVTGTVSWAAHGY